MKELVSVIMSTYNESEFELRSAVDSILTQTYSVFEFLIVLDNPQNAMIRNILEAYQKQDGRIHLIYNEKNLGLVRSLNKGIDAAQGTYLARMDADDISVPDRLEKEISYLQANDLDMVCSLKKDIDSQNKVFCEHPFPALNCEEMRKVLALSTIVVHSSVLVKTQLVKELHGYREIKAIEDYDLWLRILEQNGKIALMDEPLILYRVRENSISAQNMYRQAASSLFLQQAYQKRRLNEPSFQEKLDAWNERFHVNDEQTAARFAESYQRISAARKSGSKAALLKAAGEACRSQLMIRYICRSVAFQHAIRAVGKNG